LVNYTPATDYYGIDTIYYTLSQFDGKYTSTAAIYIYISPPPDNIAEDDCFIPVPAIEWGIKESFRSTETDVHTYVSPVVGDIDGDGIPEIFVARSVSASESDFEGIYIYWGHDRANPTTLDIVPSGKNTSNLTLAKVNIDGVITPIIIVLGSDSYLYAYNLKTMSQEWKSNTTVGFPFSYLYDGANIGIADFDGDNLQEVYAGARIWSAEKGIMLAEGTGNVGLTPSMSTIHNRYSTIAADFDNDGIVELAAGTHLYSVSTSANRTGTGSNTITVRDSIAAVDGCGTVTIRDGGTTVADINRDGKLDIVVDRAVINVSTGHYGILVWDPRTHSVICKGGDIASTNGTAAVAHSTPFIGNVDADPNMEIFVVTYHNITGWRYDVSNGAFTQVYHTTTTDDSGATGITMFDFNSDGQQELIYRDHTDLRIMTANSATGELKDTASFPCFSYTIYEYPITVDVDGRNSSAIIVTGHDYNYTNYKGSMRIYESSTFDWAPARPVWNQYLYNIVNVNKDLTIPKYYFNPATILAGPDDILGTTDDVQLFNGMLKQATSLDRYGYPIWLTPDGVFDETQNNASRTGDSITVKVCITNQGAAALGKPVYITVYRDYIHPDSIITTDSIDAYIYRNTTACMTIGVPNIQRHLPSVRLVVRLNDNGKVFPVETECDYSDSITIIINPAIDLMMKKNAILNPRKANEFIFNGTYPNPVSVLFSDTIEYKIKAVNANLTSGAMAIRDTLPPYLKRYVPSLNVISASSYSVAWEPAGTTPPREVLVWSSPSVASFDSVFISYEVTPESGVSASQPMYINHAWVQVSDTIDVMTNKTYHQGAGVSIVTFSALLGGSIYNAEAQALDYRTMPRSCIIVAPDSGYCFAGWRHDEYVSLKGEVIRADSGIMHYEDIVIYGNVELHAVFEPDKKDKPEIIKEIQTIIPPTEDKIWAAENILYVRTMKSGSIVRIYKPDGVLYAQHTIITEGTTQIHLPQGIYIVTLNNGIGYKVRL
jgi:hypothetical protein